MSVLLWIGQVFFGLYFVAVGVALVMLGATAWHLPRGEVLQAGLTVGNALVLGLLAYGRWRVRPLS